MGAIGKDQIWPLLLSACPEFTPEYNDFDDEDLELPYVCVMTLTRFLVGQNSSELYARVAHTVEKLIVDGDSYVSQFAVIGILEGMLEWPGSLSYDASVLFAEQLEPTSALYWISLKKFWNGEIPFVGADIPNAL